jgi:hypothetical protein
MKMYRSVFFAVLVASNSVIPSVMNLFQTNKPNKPVPEPKSPQGNTCANFPLITAETVDLARENPYWLIRNETGTTSAGFYGGWGRECAHDTIIANSITDMQDAMNNAAQNNMQLIVKNSGHDYIGRSTPRDENSIRLFTGNMRNATWYGDLPVKNETFSLDPALHHTVSEQFSVCDNKYDAVTVAAGVTWESIFDGMRKYNIWVLKGASNTVGAAGGWLLDGGFGLFPKINGMGVDNIVELKVVTTDGKVVTASDCENSDLFYGLLGGGPGSFGLIAEATYKVHPGLSNVGQFSCTYDIPAEAYPELLSKVLTLSPIQEKNWGGMLDFKQDIGKGNDTVGLEFWLYYGDLTKEQAAAAWPKELMDELEQYKQDVDFAPCEFVNTDTSTYPEGGEGITTATLPNGETHWWEYESYDDYIVGFGSRYLPAWNQNDTASVQTLANNIIEIQQAGNMIQLELSKGMFKADPDLIAHHDKTSVSSKIKNAVGLMYIRSYLTHYWPTQNQTFDDLEANLKLKYDSETEVFCPVLTNSTSTDNCLQQAKDQCKGEQDPMGCFDALLQQAMKISSDRIKHATELLRQRFPDAGTWVNHIAYDEPDVFNLKWGEKLDKLKALKKQYDPQNILTCHQCLSEVIQKDANILLL